MPKKSNRKGVSLKRNNRESNHLALDFLLRQPERNGKASARKKRKGFCPMKLIGFCLKDNRKGVSLKSPPIGGKGGIARIAGKEAIERIGGIVIIVIIVTINTIGTIISISLRGRQSRSEVLASKGLGSV